MQNTSLDLETIRWRNDGLIPVIAQDAKNKQVLMLAWMNREALSATIAKQEAVYWSRSRQCLWHKGEQSGCIQKIQAIYLDCDQDTLMLSVVQHGSGACHTGTYSCFYTRLENNRWVNNK